MSNISSIFEAIQYIESNLQEEITIGDVADKICYSLYHFCRMFNKATYHTPYEYIMKRRLSESAIELIDTEKMIIDIAYDYQFNSPEAYSRAFKRMFNIQPSKFRKHGIFNECDYMPALSMDYLEYINSNTFSLPVVTEDDLLTFAGYTTLDNNNRKLLSDLWNILKYNSQKYDFRLDNMTFYGVIYYPDDTNRKKYFYTASIKVETTKIVSNMPLQIIFVPYRRFVKLIHKGSYNDLMFLMKFFYHTWRYKSKKKVVLNYEIECFNTSNIDNILNDTVREMYILIPIDDDH